MNSNSSFFGMSIAQTSGKHTMGRFHHAEDSAWVCGDDLVSSGQNRGQQTTTYKEDLMKSSKKNIIVGLVLAMFMVVAATGMASAEENFTGTIIAKGDIVVLDAADGLYLLEGSDMTPDLVGKKVTVTGTVEIKDDLRVINVLSMEEVPE